MDHTPCGFTEDKNLDLDFVYQSTIIDAQITANWRFAVLKLAHQNPHQL